MAKKRAASNLSLDLRRQVKKVLVAASKNSKHPYLTAFQILARIDEGVRGRLEAERGSLGGDQAYVRRAASMDVMSAARSLTKDIVFLGAGDVLFMVENQPVTPSSKTHLAAYRLTPAVRRRNSANGRRVDGQ